MSQGMKYNGWDGGDGGKNGTKGTVPHVLTKGPSPRVSPHVLNIISKHTNGQKRKPEASGSPGRGRKQKTVPCFLVLHDHLLYSIIKTTAIR